MASCAAPRSLPSCVLCLWVRLEAVGRTRGAPVRAIRFVHIGYRESSAGNARACACMRSGVGRPIGVADGADLVGIGIGSTHGWMDGLIHVGQGGMCSKGGRVRWPFCLSSRSLCCSLHTTPGCIACPRDPDPQARRPTVHEAPFVRLTSASRLRYRPLNCGFSCSSYIIFL